MNCILSSNFVVVRGGRVILNTMLCSPQDKRCIKPIRADLQIVLEITGDAEVRC